MQKRGGGITSLELRNKTAELENYFQLHATIETKDSMGANFINSCLEQFAKTLKEEEIAPSILQQENLKIVVTSGASCPDKIVDHVIQRIIELRGETESVESALEGRI
jgi:hydroxymethylglutaryl-CoA reductase